MSDSPQSGGHDGRKSELSLETLIAASPVVIFRARRSGELRYVSPNVTRILGYSVDEAFHVFKHWQSLIHPDDAGGAAAQHTQMLVQRMRQAQFEYRILHRDGDYRWVRICLQNEYDESDVSEIIGCVLDISAERMAEDERRRLLAQERQAHAEAEALATIEQRISASLDLDTVLQTIVESAHQLIASDLTTIALADERGALRLAATVGYRQREFLLLVIPPGSGSGGLVMATGEVCFVADYGSDREMQSNAEIATVLSGEGIVSLLALPIPGGDGPIGVLWVNSRTPRRFSEAEVGLLRALAAQASTAIDNACAHATERLARAENEALLAATAVLGAQAEPEAVLERLVEGAAQLLQAQQAFYVVSGNDDALEARYWREGGWRAGGHPIALHTTALGVAWRSGNVYRSNAPQDDPMVNQELARRYGSTSLLLVPLSGADGARLGVIGLLNSRRVDGFSDRDEKLLAAFCNYAVAILARARGEKARRAAEEERSRLEGVILAARAVAHEINQDLGVIVGRAELLQMLAGADQPRVADQVMPIRQAALRLADTVGRLQQTWRVVTRDAPGIGPVLDIDASSC